MGDQERLRRAGEEEPRQPGTDGRTTAGGVPACDGDGPVAPPEPMDLVGVAVRAHGRGHHELFDEAIAALLTAPKSRLAEDLASWLGQQVAERWERGWQPADLHRVVVRQLGSHEAALLAGAVVAESSGYRALGEQVAPGWVEQVDALAAGTVHQLPDRGAPWVDLLVATVRLLDALQQLGDLPVLEPPPSRWRPGMRVATEPTGADPVLDGVRELLAGAESAEVDAEVEALTARAQALAARDRVDRAAVGDGRVPGVVVRRIVVGDPYADAKASMLDGVCAANGARAVWNKQAGFSTVFGFPAELDVVEELFTSLLLQSSRALRREGSKHDRFGRSRTTRFRRAFLDAFAQRSASRLRAVADAALDADGRRDALLGVLAGWDAAVDAAVVAAFPDASSDVTTPLGRRETWVAGTLFDDGDDLSVGDLLERRSAS